MDDEAGGKAMAAGDLGLTRIADAERAALLDVLRYCAVAFERRNSCRLTLGRWQKIFFCELDRARQRKVFIQVIGEG